MLLKLLLCVLLLLLGGVCVTLAAPPSADVFRLPPGALQVLSSKGTMILEVAMKNALLVLEGLVKSRNLQLMQCAYCIPCLFESCGNRTSQCVRGTVGSSEPSCETLSAAQSLRPETVRDWELSKVCWYYQRHCQQGAGREESCLREMQQRCHSHILQCSLKNKMKISKSVLKPERKASCGQRAAAPNHTLAMGRIVGGHTAAPGSWPWLVLLKLNGNVMCGGVLVRESWVMTAAHCFSGNKNENYWQVVTGEYDLSKQDIEERVTQINHIIIHPKFNQRTFNNDIALLELSVPVAVTELVSSVCIPEKIDELPAGTMCSIAGWGSIYEDGPSADILMEAKVPVLAQSTCKTALGKDLITSQMFCAGYLSGKVDSCQGDSGGPLTCVDPTSKQYYLYGITSWGDGCGQRNKPGVYTRVPSFTSWINEELKKLPGSREPTCYDFHKLLEMQEVEWQPEVTRLCAFYTSECPPSLGSAACNQSAHQRCRMKMKTCEVRTFLQSLLELLGQVQDFLRSEGNFSFFTDTIPKFMADLYSNIFTSLEQQPPQDQAEQIQSAGLKEERHRRSLRPDTASDTQQEASNRTLEMGRAEVRTLFEGIGPGLDDWVHYFSGISEWMESSAGNVEQKLTISKDKQFFIQSSKAQVEILKEQLQSLITSLRSQPEMGDLLNHTQIPDRAKLLTSLKHNGLNISMHESKVQKRDVSKLLAESETHLQTTDTGCLSVNESLLNLSILMETYKWILNIPMEELSMKFQEVLVDMTSKNEKELYRARVKALVAGRSISFNCLMGVENDSFSRSMASVIALALDSLKT